MVLASSVYGMVHCVWHQVGLIGQYTNQNERIVVSGKNRIGHPIGRDAQGNKMTTLGLDPAVMDGVITVFP